MYTIDERPRTFDFERGGKTYSIPTLQDIPLDVFRAMQKRIREAADDEREEEAVYATLDLIEGLAKGATKGLSFRQAAALVTAYVNYDGGDMGES